METIETGTIDFTIGEKTFQTFFVHIGFSSESQTTQSNQRPIVVLHGGPGLSHHYTLPNLQLYKTHGIPVVLYDQLGNGRSTHLRDKPASFWTVDLFMDQLDALLAHLKIEDNFDLLGHSWGGMLASEYAAIRRPRGLKRLIIANAPTSMDLWMESTRALGDTLPDGLGDVLKRHEAAGETDSPEYSHANLEFMKRHICQIYPFPPELSTSFEQNSLDPTVYCALMGVGGVYVTNGNLEKWSIIDSLHNITQPTLLLNGADDEF
ncbi:hypothetical protein MPER_08380 [Moniliophthora perniciosa FA553]|nr:hypothetical protein MPER_08380 [Moniliophthora perniciosa FA553]